MENSISVKNMNKSFKETIAIKSLKFHVNDGEALKLLFPYSDMSNME